MYLGIFLIGCGVILICFQWWLLFVFLAILAMRYVTLIVKEEKLLLEKFGDKYRDYLRRVPRLFPRIKDLIGKSASLYLPIKLKWLKKEAASIVALIVVTMLLKLRAGFSHRQGIIFVPQYIGLIIMVVFFAALTVFLSGKNESSAKQG
jgi:protein-S-isoprenylcysteine O-methyltransferase Ste14